MKKLFSLLMLLSCFVASCEAQVAGPGGQEHLVIAAKGHTSAIIVVSPDAGKETKPGVWQQYLANKRPARDYMATPPERPWEKQAALDLQKYIALMSGAKPQIADTPQTVEAALKSQAPVFLIGEAAFRAEPSLRAALDKVTKETPVLRADAIVVRRTGNRIYLAGNNDDSHYYAVSWLLQQWGCRWYLPTSSLTV